MFEYGAPEEYGATKEHYGPIVWVRIQYHTDPDDKTSWHGWYVPKIYHWRLNRRLAMHVDASKNTGEMWITFYSWERRKSRSLSESYSKWNESRLDFKDDKCPCMQTRDVPFRKVDTFPAYNNNKDLYSNAKWIMRDRPGLVFGMPRIDNIRRWVKSKVFTESKITMIASLVAAIATVATLLYLVSQSD